MINKKNIFFILGFLLVFISVFIGNIKFSINDIIDILYNKNEIYRDIILKLRIPRIINSFASGGALALSGLVIQTMIKNPLGEPYMLGISSGAAFGAVIGFSLNFQRYAYLFSFAGALLTIFLVFSISNENGMINTLRLILTGVVFNFLLSSLIMIILIFNSGRIKDYFFWTMGDFSKNNIYTSIVVLSLVLLYMLIMLKFSEEFDLIAIDEEYAFYSGVNINKIKMIVFLLISFITSIIVSLNGVIGFVGIIVPHILKKIVENKHRELIIYSFFYGGVFLVLSDTIGRSLINEIEIPVGVITSIIGGIVFLNIIRKKGEN